MKTPKVNQWPQQTPEQAQEARQRAQEWTSKLEAQRAAERPWKLKLLQAGPQLRSVDAALDCPCGCHPRIDVTTHDGGSTCTCQDTTPELKEARGRQAREALTSLRGMWDNPETQAMEAAQREAMESTAAKLGVQLKSWGGVAPFQMEGVVDGLSFYVRERHQVYRVHVAPPERPLHFVEGEGRLGQGDIVIDDGDEDDLYAGESDYEKVNALVNVARTIRDYQRRAGCSHILTNEGGSIQFRFCPVCGVRAEEITGFVQ